MQDGEFQGVMRFYFQEAGAKVATKCVRISSTATTKAVIETLVEKFRPDMRMLSIPQYALYEIHENGEERRLGEPERPLFVQLNWHSDDREGRFLLKRIDEVVRYDFYVIDEDTRFIFLFGLLHVFISCSSRNSLPSNSILFSYLILIIDVRIIQKIIFRFVLLHFFFILYSYSHHCPAKK